MSPLSVPARARSGAQRGRDARRGTPPPPPHTGAPAQLRAGVPARRRSAPPRVGGGSAASRERGLTHSRGGGEGGRTRPGLGRGRRPCAARTHAARRPAPAAGTPASWEGGPVLTQHFLRRLGRDGCSGGGSGGGGGSSSTRSRLTHSRARRGGADRALGLSVRGGGDRRRGGCSRGSSSGRGSGGGRGGGRGGRRAGGAGLRRLAHGAWRAVGGWRAGARRSAAGVARARAGSYCPQNGPAEVLTQSAGAVAGTRAASLAIKGAAPAGRGRCGAGSGSSPRASGRAGRRGAAGSCAWARRQVGGEGARPGCRCVCVGVFGGWRHQRAGEREGASALALSPSFLSCYLSHAGTFSAVVSSSSHRAGWLVFTGGSGCCPIPLPLRLPLPRLPTHLLFVCRPLFSVPHVLWAVLVSSLAVCALSPILTPRSHRITSRDCLCLGPSFPQRWVPGRELCAPGPLCLKAALCFSLYLNSRKTSDPDSLSLCTFVPPPSFHFLTVP